MSWSDILILIDKARHGDRAAFGELAQRFQPAVYAVALARLRDVHEALELTQEVFVHAMVKLPQLRDPHCFASWLKQITVRMAINRVTRKGPVKGADQDLLQATPDDLAGPLDGLIQSEDHAALHAGLAQLKPLDRDTLAAFYLRGHSLKQMSRDFATPIGTIKRRLHVARKRLKTQLERGPRGRRSGPRREAVTA